MIALTQEKREELIEVIEKSLPIMRAQLIFPHSRKGMMEHVKIYEVALASLMAEPKAYTDLEELSFKNSMSDIWNTPLGFGRDIPLFTSSPVSVINLPEKSNLPEKDAYYAGKNDGFNECLAEIKRLNGWGNNDFI